MNMEENNEKLIINLDIYLKEEDDDMESIDMDFPWSYENLTIEMVEFEDTTVEEVKEYAEEIKSKDKNVIKYEIKEYYEKVKVKKKRNYSYNRKNQYKLDKWRKFVLERDNNECQLCGCKENLHIHHIKRYVDKEDLQTDINNGITLCSKCHEKTYNREEKYEKLFLRIILNKILMNFNIENINDIIYKDIK